MSKVAASPSSSQALIQQNWSFRVKSLVGQNDSKRLRSMPEFEGKKMLLFPDDPAMQLWSVLITLLMLYTATVTPYRVALVDIDSGDWQVLDFVIDGIFAVDVVINCFLCYYDNQMSLVTSHLSILLRYLRTWMLVDILASVPFQVIIDANSGYNNMAKLARLPRIYKLVKLAKLFRIMKVIKNRNRIMVYVNSIFRIGLSLERLLWFALSLILMLHLFCCLWIFIGKLNDPDYSNWIMGKGYMDLQPFELYLVGLYFSVTTLATVGYGDITPSNNTERIVCSVMMLVGIFVYSITIGSLTNILINLDRRKAALNGKINMLTDLSSKYRLNKLFYQKLTQAIEYEHRNSPKEVDELINSLPSTLRTQLLIVIYSKLIQNNAFFEGRTDHFVAWVAPQLHPTRIVEGEYIYREVDPALEMFFVVRGEVVYVLTQIAGEPGYHTVKTDYYFGEEDLLFADKHAFTVKTVLNSEFLTLSKENFDKLLAAFETEGLEIVSMAEKRNLRIKEHRETALQAAADKARVIRHESAPKKPSALPLTKIAESLQEDPETDSPTENTAPTNRTSTSHQRFPSIDLLQKGSTVAAPGRDKLVRQYTKRAIKKLDKKEMTALTERMEKIEGVVAALESLIMGIYRKMGGSPPRIMEPAEFPPSLAVIKELGSREMD